jgi:hypothetical protein
MDVEVDEGRFGHGESRITPGSEDLERASDATLSA